MEKKALKNRYRSLEQFRADAQTIVHNVVIYHGGKCFVYIILFLKPKCFIVNGEILILLPTKLAMYHSSY